MKDFLLDFLRYNHEANRRFIDAVRSSRLKSERIARIFSHLLNAQEIWNTRIGGVSPMGGVWGMHPIEEWSRRNQELFARSREIVEFDRLDRVVDYTDLSGNSHQSTVQQILTHIVNHSTYHRGQLALLFGMEQANPPVTDFIVYTREAW